MRFSFAALIFLLMFASPGAAATTVDIVAVPSSFTPNAIVLHVGETSTLHFSNTQGVHAISSEALGISSTVLAPGKDVDISVTPRKAGTYVLHCEIVCGADHDNMALTVRVDP